MSLSVPVFSDEILSVLLADRTTGGNIIWATDDYAPILAQSQILAEQISGENAAIKIMPRVLKQKDKQQSRTKKRAEVFTPSWVCKDMIDMLDEQDKETPWQDYVLSNRLEITCGEAPFIASRYDTVTGEVIEVENRIGLLDRKLFKVAENTSGFDEWLLWAEKSLQSVYGYEWQGDNLFLARQNLLLDMEEHCEHRFGKKMPPEKFLQFAQIVSWNVWQMDGLRCVIPNSCHDETVTTQDLFDTKTIVKKCEACSKGYGTKHIKKHNGIYCKIMDWKENEIVRFVDLFKDEKIAGQK